MRFSLVALTAAWVATVSASPFLVRRDTEFLVDRTGWTATASANTANTGLAFDSNLDTSWQNGYAQNGNEWFNISFPSTTKFNQLVIGIPGSATDWPRGLVLYVYPTANGNPTVITPTNSSTNGIYTYTLPTVQQAIAVSLHVTQTSDVDWWTITELNLYYTPPTGLTLLPATPNYVTSNANQQNLALDNDVTTVWQSGLAMAGTEVFQVDLGANYYVSYINLLYTGHTADYARGWKVYVWASGQTSANGQLVATGAVSGAPTDLASQVVAFPATQARYVSFHQTGTAAQSWWTLSEFQVWGISSATVTTTTTTKAITTSSTSSTSSTITSTSTTKSSTLSASSMSTLSNFITTTSYITTSTIATSTVTVSTPVTVTVTVCATTCPTDPLTETVATTTTTTGKTSTTSSTTTTGKPVTTTTTTGKPATTTTTTSQPATTTTTTGKPATTTTTTSQPATTTTTTGKPATTTTTTSKPVTTTTTTSKPVTTTSTSATPTPTGPVTVASYGDWVSLGCYTDDVAARSLTVGMGVANNNVTVESCADACYASGYPLAGLEYSTQCFCDYKIQNNGAFVAGSPSVSACSMTCQGNALEYCGGPNRLNVYNYTGTISSGTTGGGGGPTGGPTPKTTGLPGKWTYAGCFIDAVNGRSIGGPGTTDSNMTAESCIAFCTTSGYSVAGIEFSTQCFCGNYVQNGATPIANPGPNDCTMACGGDSTEACGGPNRLTVYTTQTNITILPAPSVKKTGLPGKWTYTGCYAEGPNGNTGLHALPWQFVVPNNMTVELCLNECNAYGYPAAGIEYADECYCGDFENIAAQGGGPAAESDCDMACPGDPTELCGAGNRFTLYQWNVTLNNWLTPEITGYYQFLIGSPVVPLLTTLTIDNKVVMLEKVANANINSTHAYEFDYTLSDSSLAFREMHVASDVFCSAGVVLPDIAGRVLNIGGWSEDSLLGVRLYTPTGSFGVNGTTDWEENGKTLKLQMPRWYPTALPLANGSIAIVGGEIGSNGVNQPNMEILPTPPGGYVIDLNILQTTDTNNLYPFMYVLPSGKIFIQAYNQAQLLDPVSFEPVVILPNSPGAVGIPGGRTYPLEGSSAILPMYPPYDRAEIITCGGSVGPGQTALDNCIRMAPEDDNPTWTLERMPFKRVMPNMVALPDGTYLIVNGCKIGTAGFGLGDDPTLTAVLYNPAATIGSRFSILNTTIVARMYHSEALLMHDGRVLITGSDPLDPNYPEEYRIEVYVPWYLLQGYRQPTYTFVNNYTDWKYGDNITIKVKLYQGTTSTMQANVLTNGVNTHSNHMGNRFLGLAFTCTGNTCTLTAPPNANVCPPGWFMLFILDGPTPSYGQWVRIGGDPASLGKWPDLPGFTTPE